MPGSTNYTTIRADEDARNEARVTKAKLGLTWSEFLSRAANTLDPDSID